MKIYVTGDTHQEYNSSKLSKKCFPEQKELTKDDFVRYTAPIRDLFPRLLQKVGVLRHFYSLANISNKIWVKETKNRFKSLHLRALTCFFIYPPKKKSMATQNSAAPIRKLKGNSVIQTQHFQILQQIFEFKLIYI